MPQARFTSYNEAGWRGVRAQVKRAVFDEDFSEGELLNAAYLPYWCSSMTEVRGFEGLVGATNMRSLLQGCTALESIFCAPGADFSGVESDALILSGCSRLVGGLGTRPTHLDQRIASQSWGERCSDRPDADTRLRYWGHLYSDGELVLTASGVPEAGRELSTSGRLCAQGRYTSIGYMARGGVRGQVQKATFASDMGSYPYVNLCYMFHSFGALSEVAGLDNLAGTRIARYAFANCDAHVELDLCGLATDQLEDLDYFLSGCNSLTTIWVDADFALPAGSDGLEMFNGCTSLAGGAGTAWSSSATGMSRCRIDGGTAAPGYLTAKGVDG